MTTKQHYNCRRPRPDDNYEPAAKRRCIRSDYMSSQNTMRPVQTFSSNDIQRSFRVQGQPLRPNAYFLGSWLRHRSNFEYLHPRQRFPIDIPSRQCERPILKQPSPYFSASPQQFRVQTTLRLVPTDYPRPLEAEPRLAAIQLDHVELLNEPSKDSNKIVCNVKKSISAPALPPLNFKDKKSLSIQRPEVIDALHQVKGKICGTCGWLYIGDEETKFAAHMDEHFRQNRCLKQMHGPISRRQPFHSISSWLEDCEPVRKVETENIVNRVACDAGIASTCYYCQEELDIIFDPDESQWFYESAIQLHGIICHPHCRSKE